jgi:hypothetical protein
VNDENAREFLLPADGFVGERNRVQIVRVGDPEIDELGIPSVELESTLLTGKKGCISGNVRLSMSSRRIQ